MRDLAFASRAVPARQLAAERNPSVAERVVVFPVAAGEVARRTVAYAQRGNLGNTVVGQRIADACRREGKGDPAADAVATEACLQREPMDELTVTVLPLATLFPTGLSNVLLIKLDTQGYECKVLDGARALLASATRLRGIVTEVAPRWLFRHCCKPLQLLARLHALPGWEVACDHGRRVPRGGSERTCVGRRPADGPPKLVNKPTSGSRRRNRTTAKLTTARSTLGLPYESVVEKPATTRLERARAWAEECQRHAQAGGGA